MGTFCNTKNAITSRRTWGLRMKERHYSLELRPKTESAALFSGTCRVLPLLLVSPQIVRRILMDNGLSVCATTIHLAATYKLLSAKHFAKLLTVRASLRKDRLRPGKEAQQVNTVYHPCNSSRQWIKYGHGSAKNRERNTSRTEPSSRRSAYRPPPSGQNHFGPANYPG